MIQKRRLTRGAFVEMVASTKSREERSADDIVVESALRQVLDEGVPADREALEQVVKHSGIAPVEPPLLNQHSVPRPRNK